MNTVKHDIHPELRRLLLYLKMHNGKKTTCDLPSCRKRTKFQFKYQLAGWMGIPRGLPVSNGLNFCSSEHKQEALMRWGLPIFTSVGDLRRKYRAAIVGKVIKAFIDGHTYVFVSNVGWTCFAMRLDVAEPLETWSLEDSMVGYEVDPKEAAEKYEGRWDKVQVGYPAITIKN